MKWIRYDRVGDRQVRLHFMTGDPSCYGVRAEVKESAAAIDITILEGTVPGAPENCPANAAEASLLVTLREPVGDRRVGQPG